MIFDCTMTYSTKEEAVKAIKAAGFVLERNDSGNGDKEEVVTSGEYPGVYNHYARPAHDPIANVWVVLVDVNRVGDVPEEHRAIHVVKATNFLKAHGNVNHVAHTEDGIIATAWETTGLCRLEVMEGQRDEDDMWFEVTEVFPVVNGTVDMGSIRNWLGY